MDAYKREVGARLLQLREARGWSQEDAAHAVGATTSSWGRWERGDVLPQHSWRKIAAAFDVDVAQLRGVPPAPLGLLLDRNDGKPLTEGTLREIIDDQIRLSLAQRATREAEELQRIETRLGSIEVLLQRRRQ